MIPSFDEAGNLPPGIHVLTWEELEQAFGQNKHRKRLLRGLYEIVVQLKIAGCRRVYIDGSFVTNEGHPADFDACWDPAGVDPYFLDPVLLDCRPPRAAQHAKYFGEACPSSAFAAPGFRYVQFFQRDKTTGEPKGIIAIELTRFEVRS